MFSPIINRQSLVNFGQNRAIIIGIDSYPKITNGHLSTPISDAAGFAEVLTKYQGFRSEDVLLVADPTKEMLDLLLKTIKEPEHVSKENIDKFDEANEIYFEKSKISKAHRVKLKDFILHLKIEGEEKHIANEDDEKDVDLKKEGSLIFYYAGHGVAGDLENEDEPVGYLMPSDAKRKSGTLAENDSLIQMEAVFSAIESLNYHHSLLILDCCFAGAFRRIQTTRASFGIGHRPMTRVRFNRYARKRAMQVLVSAGPAEKAADWIEGRNERGKSIEASDGRTHSPFAKALIDGLSPTESVYVKPKGKLLGDGVITSFELFIYLHQQVEKYTREASNFKPQNPDLFPMGKNHDGGQFVFCDPRYPLNQLTWAQRRNDNPYKGLDQLDIEDSGYYFGREADIETLTEIMQLELEAQPHTSVQKFPSILMITGPSGSGKSSLVKAGLLPKFLENGYELFQLRPGEKPWQLLQYRLVIEEDKKNIIQDDKEYAWQVISGEVEKLLSTHLDHRKKQILYLDQYEEVFTECSDEKQKQLEETLIGLFKQIKETQTTSQLRIILSMRSDFEWKLAMSNFGKECWARKEYTQLYRLSHPRLEELRSALVNPALMLAYEFEEKNGESLVDVILEDLNYQSATLPLLSYTMQAFVNANKKKRAGKRKFTKTTYQKKLGGVQGLLSKRMDEIYKSFADKGQKVGEESLKQQLMKHIFLRMVRLNDGEYSRRRVFRRPELDELVFFSEKTKQEIVEEVLKSLEHHHIISRGGSRIPTSEQKDYKYQVKKDKQNHTIIPYVELIHDSLINTWGKGKQWINEFGKVNLVLQHQLWQAVEEFTSKKPLELDEKTTDNDFQSTEVPQVQIPYLWDNNPRLQQVFFSIIDPKDELKQEENFDEREGAAVLWNDDVEKSKKRGKMDSLLVWLKKNNIINEALDSQSTVAEAALSHILSSHQSWLNEQEASFILQSWKKKNEWIKQLKNERDEAKAIALAATARWKHTEDPTIAYNLAYAGFHMTKTPETVNTFRDILNEEAAYYKQNYKYISPREPIISIVFSVNRKYVLTRSRNNNAKLWDIERGKKVPPFSEHKKPVIAGAFSPDGKYVLTGSEDSNAILWDTKSGEKVHIFSSHAAFVSALAFSPCGDYVLTGGWDDKVELWKIDSEVPIRTFKPNHFQISTLVFSPDGNYFLTGGVDGCAKLWQVENNESPILTFSKHKGAVTSAAFSPDGRYILTGSRDNSAKLWDKESINNAIFTFSGHKAAVTAVAFSPDGKYILTGSKDNSAKLWDIQNKGKEVSTFLGHSEEVLAVDFSIHDTHIGAINNNLYALTMSRDHSVKLWNINGKRKIYSHPGFQLDHKPKVFAVAFSSDGSCVLTGSKGKNAELWNMATGMLIHTLSGHTKPVTSVAFSADGNYLLTGSKDKTAKLWDRKTGKEMHIFSGHKGPVNSVAFSTDGLYVITGSEDNTVKLWNRKIKRELYTLSEHTQPVTSVAFSLDDRYILTGSKDMSAMLWDRESGYKIHTLQGNIQAVYARAYSEFTPHIYPVAFSRDGRYILTGSGEKTAILWDLMSGMRIHTFKGHDDDVLAVAFSPDSHSILTGSKDKTAKLWDRKTGIEIYTFLGHDSTVTSVAFSRDGRYVSTGDILNSAKLWYNPLTFTPYAYKLNAEERQEYRIPIEY